jgi:hypothetical protein
MLNTRTVTAHKGAGVHQSANEFRLVVCTMISVHLQLFTDRFKAHWLSDSLGEGLLMPTGVCCREQGHS